MLTSALCTASSLQSDIFLTWAERLRPAWDVDGSGRPPLTHRKLWEWIFIAQALEERDMLQPGRRGLGFGVGREPLAALFASAGCAIVATDLDTERARRSGWVDTGQHAEALEHLNEAGLCDPRAFAERVSFQVVDMNRIPDDLTGFDFAWSSCSFEHLGSIRRGQSFILNQLACLQPGGVAVHTTEYNLSSNRRTLDHDQTVLFRRCDIERLVEQLCRDNHAIELDLDVGRTPADRHVDAPPYSDTHLRVRLHRYAATSLGLVIEKNPFEVLSPDRHRRVGLPDVRRLTDSAAVTVVPWLRRLKTQFRGRGAVGSS